MRSVLRSKKMIFGTGWETERTEVATDQANTMFQCSKGSGGITEAVHWRDNHGVIIIITPW